MPTQAWHIYMCDSHVLICIHTWLVLFMLPQIRSSILETILLSLIVQPQTSGSGIGGWLILLVDHIPACKIALLMCWSKASFVGGMFSRLLHFLEKSYLLASFTVSSKQLLSYMTVKRSNCLTISESVSTSWNSWWYTSTNVLVTIG